MNMQLFSIDFATPLYSKTIELRDEVLRRPLNIYFTEQQLSEEWNQFHLVAVSEEQQELLGVLVLKPISKDVVKMRQVAVSPLHQRKGVGQKLVQFSEQFARMHQFKKMELSAREVAVPFYLQLDYEKIGDRYVEVNIPHYKMQKEL